MHYRRNNLKICTATPTEVVGDQREKNWKRDKIILLMVIEASQKPGESHSASDLNPTGLEENVNAPLLERKLLLQTIPHLIPALQSLRDEETRRFVFPLDWAQSREETRSSSAEPSRSLFVCLTDLHFCSSTCEPAGHGRVGGALVGLLDVTQRSWPALHPVSQHTQAFCSNRVLNS